MTEAKPARQRVPFPVVLLLLLVAGLLLGGVVIPRFKLRGLVDELGDSSRSHAAYVRLKDMGAEPVPALLSALSDPAWAGRDEAIDLLGRAGDARAVEPLLAITEPDLQDERLDALGRLRGDRALAEVLKALRGQDVALQFPALRALIDWKEAPTETLVADVEPFLRSEQSGLREFAARFMGARRHAPAVGALIGLLSDPDAGVRQTAALALKQLGDPAGIAAVDSAMATGAVTPEEN
jgi:HEAT repeat protein